jgi:16S rRNA (cytosine1402-N4)-methyltransferase
MVEEVLDCLSVRAGGVYVDGTVGSGGHARAVLDRGGPGTVVLGFDRDGEALTRTRRVLDGADGKVELRHGNFADLLRQLFEQGRGQVDGVLLDLGVSSEQLDTPERGFSFMRDGPLDMRMDQSAGLSAAELVNTVSEPELAGTIASYGEERASRRIARAIVSERRRQSISTTLQLAGIVEKAVGSSRGRIHPATRTFQALRIAVNGELDELRRGLESAMLVLRPGGRLVVISFHSLEDRMVKQFMAAHVGRWAARQEGGTHWVGDAPPARHLTRRPVVPSEAECAGNPRARSAKLRAVERLSEPCRHSGGMQS